jgi:hypothetical protein
MKDLTADQIEKKINQMKTERENKKDVDLIDKAQSNGYLVALAELQLFITENK